MAVVKVLQVLAPGLLTTVQDLGRYGYGRYGVAPSGALDSLALRVANVLVGNPEIYAGLETMLLGLRCRVLTDIVIAVAGADLQPRQNQRRQINKRIRQDMIPEDRQRKISRMQNLIHGGD